MDSLASLLTLVLLVGVLVVMLRGPRAGRQGQRDPLTKPGVPDGSFGIFLLGTLAIAQLIAATNRPDALSLGTGAIVGIILGPLVRFPPTQAVLSLVGFAAGLIGLFRLVTSQSLPPPTGANAMDSGLFRWALALLTLACFALGAGLGQTIGRPLSAISLGRGRGMTFFALVDFITFAAAPAGAQLLDLEPGRFYVYLGIVALASAILGMASSPFVLWVMGALLALTNIGLPLAGVTHDPWAIPTAGFCVAALVTFSIMRALVSGLKGL